MESSSSIHTLRYSSVVVGYCVAVSVGLVFVRFQRWKYQDSFWNSVTLPFEWLAYLLAGTAFVWAIVHVAEGRRARVYATTALLAIAVGLVLTVAIPSAELSTDDNFRRYRKQREEVVQLAWRGQLEAVAHSQDLKRLPWRYRHLSDSGEVMVSGTDVLFWTFRGLLTGGTCGFLYVAEDQPSMYGYARAEKKAPHWFWVCSDD